MTAYAGDSLFQTCDDEDAVLPMLDAYRSGQGFIGTFEYEPIGADNSLVATGLPQACLVGDPAMLLGKEAADPDTPPAWDAAQGSCEATYAAASNSRPEHHADHGHNRSPGLLGSAPAQLSGLAGQGEWASRPVPAPARRRAVGRACAARRGQPDRRLDATPDVSSAAG